jgi:hypothetical protein
MPPPQKPAARRGLARPDGARSSPGEGPPLAYAPLRERFLMTWEMTWPLALLDLAVILLIHGVMETQTETLDSVWAVIGFFVVSPWVVRRALARSYRSIRIAVVAHGQDRAKLTYQQSLKVMWLLAWRSTVLALAGLLVLSALLRVVGLQSRDLPAQGPLVNALGLAAVDAITSLIFFPFLIPGMIRKRYRDFHLELRSTSRK